MKKSFLLLLIIGLTHSCKKNNIETSSPLDLIPSQTKSLILINELNDFNTSLKSHDILSNLYKNNIDNASIILENLNTSEQVVIGFPDQNNSDYLILTKNDSSVFKIDSIKNHISERLANVDIDKIQVDSVISFHKIYGNIFAASNNLELLKNLDSKNRKTPLRNLISTTNKKSLASVVFKTHQINPSKLLFENRTGTDNENYVVLDLNASDNSLYYNGVFTSNDSINNKFDCFKHTVPQKSSVISIAPSSTSTLLSFTFDNFSNFNKNLSTLKNIDLDSTQTFLNFTNEIALLDNAVVLHSLDSDLVLESIEDKLLLETYRNNIIYEFGDSEFFDSRLKPFISYRNAKFFTQYDEYVIFSNSIEALKSIISNVLNNNTLVNSDAFESIKNLLSDENSLFVYKDSKSLSNLLETDLNGYDANVLQLVYEDNYLHVNGVIQKYKKRRKTNSVTEAFTTSFNSELLIAPQTVKNHLNNTHDIAVQDANNVLHLISSSGNLLWKKQLRGKILGKIEQIDMYKNGRLQLAFATPNRLYVLDRNGNDVSPFPRKFNNEITQPLSVFDYDKRKDYRLLITQGKHLLMYDGKGSPISGFKYSSNGKEITNQPKHFRIGSKDYIAFTTGNELKVLNRQGNTRVNVKDKISFSNNELYLYQNKFTSTNTLGQLVQVDTKGKVALKNLNLPEIHHLETTSKTLVSMTENKLNIKTRSVDLDYGDYTAPRIYYLNDKIYITTTDLQSKKVYLFDSQAKALPNFPVFGTSEAELQKLDNNKGLELITQADNNTVIVYKIH